MVITLNISGAIRRLRNIERNIDRIDWTEIGRIGLRSIDKNFLSSGRYSNPGEEVGGNKKWEKRKDNLPHPILIKSGSMRRGVKFRLKSDGVVLVSDQPYSAAQNYGYSGRNLPARPFMTIHPDEIKEMERNLVEQLTRLSRR